MSEEVTTAVKENIDKIVDDAKTISGEKTKIHLKNGTEYDIPPYDIDDDMNLITWFGVALEKCPRLLNNLSSYFMKDDQTKKLSIEKIILDSLPEIFKIFPELLKQLLCIILKQKYDWVKLNISFKEAMDIVPPFFTGEHSLRILLEKISDLRGWGKEEV